MANDYPELSRAVPSINHPIIDRQLRPSQVWYPYFVKLAGFIDGIANGELIVDGKITTNLIAAEAITTSLISADAITADLMAANAITAANAALGNASVETLKIAGNAVTLAASAASPTQFGFDSTTKANLDTLAMTTSGYQPLLVWGVVTVGGATEVTSGEDYTYEGLKWANNAGDQPLELDVTVDGQTSDAIYVTVPAAQSFAVPFAFTFSSVSSGSQTIALRGQLTPHTYDIAVRDITIVGLETKR